MIFDEFETARATGVVLAHTVKLADRTLRKGKVLDADCIDALADAGVGRVWGARMEPGDVGEDYAAWEVATLIAGERTTTRKPYTGRCNVHAGAAGVVVIDAERIERLNFVDEAITVGTLPPFAAVRKGQVLATVKVIPFAVGRGCLDAYREQATRPMIRVAEFVPHRVALVVTANGGPDRQFDAVVAAAKARVEAAGSRLELVLQSAHEPAAVEAALGRALAAGCDLLLVAGATVTKDRKDVVPAGIVRAGGVIDHFGMPVEPGNMLLLARIGDVPVVNLPGCARSLKLNGCDWVLQRLFAKLGVSRADIVRMGVGGLIHSPLRDDHGGMADDVPAARAGLEHA